MKTSEKFKTIIENYLSETALNDSALAPVFTKTSKNIEDCLKYIISEVKKTGECAFHDSEIFDIALQYYKDDTIKAPADIKCRVMLNQPAKADLFSAPIETAQTAIFTEEKTPVIEIPKPAQTTLTLFDL